MELDDDTEWDDLEELMSEDEDEFANTVEKLEAEFALEAADYANSFMDFVESLDVADIIQGKEEGSKEASGGSTDKTGKVMV